MTTAQGKIVHRCELGQTLVLTALALPVFIAVIGLAADTGNLYFNYCKLQMAADAAVLAGSKCLPSETNCDAVATANNYAAANSVVASDTVTGPTEGAGNTTLTLGISRLVPFYFARLVGISNGTASVTAAARSGPAGIIFNAFPLGLQVCEASIVVCTTPYSVGEALSFAAKKNDGTGSWVSGSGVWSAVNLDYANNTVSVCAPPAAPCISANSGFSKVQTIISEANALISQGMKRDPGGTAISHSPDDPRAVAVPLVDWSLGGPGCNGACNLNTYGFAEIWLTGAADNGPNSSYISAQFISQSASGVLDTTGTAQDVGAYAIKLIK